MTSASLSAQANEALARGELEQAIALLQQAADAAPDDPATWLKLGSLQRAAKRPAKALAAIERGLALTPLDFVLLVMRASLIERMADPRAGEAWGQALAQRPAGTLDLQLAAAVAQGEECHASWLAYRAARMERASATIEARADGEEQARLARFRSNILRRTRPYHSDPTHFHFPGLTEREFHPRRLFPWLADLEAATDTIAAELTAVMAAERAELVPYVQYDAYLPLDQWKALNHNLDWTAIHLLQNGREVPANARHCPVTLAHLARIGQPQVEGASPNAMFSLLAPHTVIPPHVGVSNARLVCHLPLIVPAGCWFRVGAETRQWQRGAAFVFDDTIEHEAANPSDELRVVMIFDLWHPDLSDIEREGVAAIVPRAGGEASAGL